MSANSDSQTVNTFGDQQPNPTTPLGVFGEQTLENASSDSINTTTPPKGSKISRKKAFLAILGVILVIGAVVAGVFLVQRQQDLREQASSASACDQDPNCVVFDDPGNEGIREVNRQILRAVITNQPGNEAEFGQGDHDDGCYIVNIDGNTIHWQKYGSGPDCKDVSNIQVWLKPEGRVSPIPCSLNEESGIIVVKFDEKTLKANGSEGDAKTGPFSVNLPVGKYKVALESYDNHSDKPDQSQTQEQWFLSLLAQDSSSVAQTSSISDLPEDLDFLKEEVNSGLEVAADVASVIAIHTAYESNNVNSIVPVCASFERITDDPTPTDVITGIPTSTPTTPPGTTAQCLSPKAYDTQWNLLSSGDLSSLAPGDTVRFAVSGTATSGFFDKARFTINGTQRPEVTSKKPGTQEFFDEYVIPEGTTSFKINAQVHHSDLGWF